MLTLSDDAILEKNTLATPGAWLELAELTLPGETTPALRLAANTQDVYWPGENLVAGSNDLSSWTKLYGSDAMSYPVTSWDGSATATEDIISSLTLLAIPITGAVAGARYKFSAWVNRRTGSAQLVVYLRTGGSTLTKTSFVNGEWTLVEGTFINPGTFNAIWLYLFSGSRWNIADIQIVRDDVLSPMVRTTTAPATPVIYTACPFAREDMEESARGGDATLRLRLGNVSGAVQAYLEANSGLVGASLRLMLVHSDHLDLTTPEVDQTFTILSASCDAQWAYLDLGADSPLGKRVPRTRLLKANCRWKFKSLECGYSGATATCNKTIGACRAMDGGSNSARFGGYPGVGRGGLYG